MRIKAAPEDFFVREVLSLDTKSSGRFIYFLLKKRDFTTLEAVKRVANALNVSSDRIGFAGLKDRRAVTEQYCSAKGVSRKQVESISISDIGLSFIGFGDSPIYRGQNEGNFFRVVVRDADVPEKKTRFVNLFGEQRFSKENHEIGKAIVKSDFSRACELLKKQGWVDSCTPDPISIIRKVRSVLQFCIHAYQSLLWNKAALLWAKKTSDGKLLPLVGFGTEDIDDITKLVLDDEGISPRDFIIRELPDISAEGSERQLYVEVKDLKIEKKNGNITLEFTLPSGSYATVFVRQLFEPLL